jgi:hypothetical protein
MFCEENPSNGRQWPPMGPREPLTVDAWFSYAAFVSLSSIGSQCSPTRKTPGQPTGGCLPVCASFSRLFANPILFLHGLLPSRLVTYVMSGSQKGSKGIYGYHLLNRICIFKEVLCCSCLPETFSSAKVHIKRTRHHAS